MERLDGAEIGRRLCELRGGRTQQEVADALGVGVSTIGMYERGERIPKDEIKVMLANLYGRTVQEIFFD
jgi:transcriptional regulator with XRE-family HTH domain